MTSTFFTKSKAAENPFCSYMAARDVSRIGFTLAGRPSCMNTPTLPLDRSPVSCPSEQPLATAPVFVERSPPDVRRATQFRVPQTVFDRSNAGAKSDDGN